ncbi:DnaJ domain-containing protein [Fusobacterium sp.]|uniref:J domain-containing protein n=1 Tax=Fusobacterium sp. TaxID=68766 RepID=UPI0025B7EDC7|nr:DnaJ domain-containing protein [Fusobacterium sp.]
MQNKNLYEILGVSSTATKDEIKKRYRECAKKYHPDRFATASEGEKQKAEKLFRDINDAYSILSDDSKRKEYDEQLLRKNNSFKKTMYSDKKSTSNTFTGKSQNFQEIYENLTKGNIFGDFFDPEKNKEKDKSGAKIKEQTNNMFEAFFFQGRKKK